MKSFGDMEPNWGSFPVWCACPVRDDRPLWCVVVRVLAATVAVNVAAIAAGLVGCPAAVGPAWAGSARVRQGPVRRAHRPPRLRLVGGLDDDGPLPPADPITEQLSLIRRQTEAIERISFAIAGRGPDSGGVSRSALRLAGGEAPPVVASSPSGLEAAIESWRANLLTRGCKPHSIERMNSTIRACARAAAWGDPSQVNYAGAVTWLASKQTWKPATVNQAVSTLRGFGAHLQRCGLVPTNPLQALQSVKGYGDPGSRAETPEAVRRLLEAAIKAHLTDRRRKGISPLFWYFLATTGLRYNEARSIRWQDVDLDEGLITTAPEWCKSRRRDLVPIFPPLLEMLRDWRVLDGNGSAIKNPSSTARIFPIAPNHVTFRMHRDAAGIPAIDGRRRPFSPHGLRKCFATWLDEAGCPAGIRSLLVRHATTITESTYTDPPIGLMREWLARMADPWPPGMLVIPKRPTEKESSLKSVDDGEKIRYGVSATKMTECHTQIPEASKAGPRSTGPSSLIDLDSRGLASGASLLESAAKSGIRQRVGRHNGQGLAETNGSLNERIAAVLADYLAQSLAQEPDDEHCPDPQIRP